MDWARRRGFDPRLNIGVGQTAAGVEGHAWLSIGREPFCERAAGYLRYPVCLDEGGIVYWFGDEKDMPRKADIIS